ncbi:type I restriction-modification system subunit M [Burkholderia cepacia]|uniref:type I restriction-modification system subunit M n=1 Tax=Burkholderia cepacia TaxID=292 RepID=UPI00158BDCE9|nr:class I SAM-dependent DNA methyltransferase [Burkholderia cepacia]
MSIGTLIKTIQDIMRKDVGVDGDAQRISQIVWLLFLKIFDDKEQEWELTIRGYRSPLQSRFRWSNWAKNAEGITGDELIDFVNNELFPSLKRLATTAGVAPHGKVVGAVFEDAYNYMKSGTLLRQVINTIEEDVDFNSSTDRHLFNDIYEKILADLQSAGNAGEYYTPRAVTQFMVDILNPQLGEAILDPACGTGGFLTCAIDHLKRQVKTPGDNKKMQESIHGVEKKPLPHMLAMTNMMLHGIDVPTNILHDNTLSRPLKEYGPKDRVDIILTNPPFGGMEEDGIENNFPRKYQTRETADLFMALIMHLLKHDTGRAAVVLPGGFLFGEGVKTVLKRELLEEFNLHTIVRLPKGVFAPYTSIATNILFFEKGGPTKDIWFFEHPYPDESYRSYSRSRPLTIDEFKLEKKWWGGPTRKGRKTTAHAWKVSATEIAARNYNLYCDNPHEVEVNHRDPDELMAEYREIAWQLTEAQNALKAELVAALASTTGGN